MKLLDAAYQVLSQAGHPLRAEDIARRIIAGGQWHTTGKTPAATVGAQLYVDIRAKGPSSRFVRAGRGLFGANQNPPGSQSQTNSAASVNTSSGTTVTLSFVDAAEKVLAKHANRQPMHYVDITNKALQDGLISTSGKTPAATMYAQILTEIQRRTLRGQPPRFSKHGKGLVGLTIWQGSGLALQIAQHNQRVRKELHRSLLKMPPADFEALVGRLLGRMGFEQVTLTPLSGDGGIDVRGTLVVGDVVHTKMAVQVKRWVKNVQAPTVQQVRGSLTAHEQGMIVTTSDFSQGASQDAAKPNAVPIALMNGEQLLDLLIEHGIGVHREPYFLIELGEGNEQ